MYIYIYRGTFGYVETMANQMATNVYTEMIASIEVQDLRV